MSRYRWTILAVGVGAQTAFSALRQGLPSLGPALQSHFHLGLTQIGLVLASVNVGIVLTLLAWGVLADRRGERPVLALGLGGCAAALVGAAAAPTYGWLLLTLALAGASGSAAIGGSGRAVMNWFSRAERGLALGIRQTGVPLGGGVAAISLPLLASALGLRGALLALAIGAAVASLASARWMRDAPERPVPAAAPPAPPPLRDRRLWRLAAGSSLIVVAQSGMFGFLVIYLHRERGWAPTAAAAALAALYVGGALARILSGRWSDRLEERVAPVRRLVALSSLLILAAVGLAAAGAPTAALLPALLLGGVLAASWNALSFTAAAELSGRRRAGTAIGVQNTLLNAGAALAPVWFAAVVTATSWELGWSLLAVSQLAGVAILGPLVAEERARRAARHRRTQTVHARLPA
jgi:sugar phosphate permease